MAEKVSWRFILLYYSIFSTGGRWWGTGGNYSTTTYLLCVRGTVHIAFLSVLSVVRDCTQIREVGINVQYSAAVPYITVTNADASDQIGLNRIKSENKAKTGLKMPISPPKHCNIAQFY